MARARGLLALLVAAAVGVVAFVVLADDDDFVVDPGDSIAQPSDASGRAIEILDQLTRAVVDRDVATAISLADEADATSRSQLSALAVNAESLDVVDFTLRFVDRVTPVEADGTWQGAVDATWRFDGFDDEPARAELTFTFGQGSDPTDLVVVGIGGGGRISPIWMTGPVSVRSTSSAMVVAAGEGDRLGDYLALAEVAVAELESPLERQDARLVVEVPDNAAALDTALAADPGRYQTVAAVTSVVDGTIAPGRPIHVFLNPDVYDGLDDVGAQVVMTHEAVHAFTSAPLSRAPLWLLEGYADLLALRDVDLPIGTTAGQIIAEVQANGVPAQLPSRVDFDTSRTKLGAAYEAAWIACRVLAEIGGEEALLRLYREASDGVAFDAALRRELGVGVDRLTGDWQQELRRLAT